MPGLAEYCPFDFQGSDRIEARDTRQLCMADTARLLACVSSSWEKGAPTRACSNIVLAQQIASPSASHTDECGLFNQHNIAASA